MAKIEGWFTTILELNATFSTYAYGRVAHIYREHSGEYGFRTTMDTLVSGIFFDDR